MDVISLSQLQTGSVLWRPRPDRWTLTIVCKATYALEPGESTLAPDQEAVNEREGHWDSDPRRSVHAPSDLVPFKPRADVVLVGHAYAPRSELARSLVVRLMVGEMEKAVEVHCPRALSREGDLREGQRWSKMPLHYEYAAGGLETWNPVGIGPNAPADPYGQRPLPHLQPPGLRVAQWNDIFVPTGLGPLSPAWRIRREKLGRRAEVWSDEGWTQIALDDDFDGEFFQVAPPDQQLDALRDDERLVLEYLHPDHPSLTTKLPGVHPHAFVEIPGNATRDLVMTADTLWIDTDRALCTLTWRGQVAVDGPDQQGRVLVALEETGQTVDLAVVSGARSSGGTLVPQPPEGVRRGITTLPFLTPDLSAPPPPATGHTHPPADPPYPPGPAGDDGRRPSLPPGCGGPDDGGRSPVPPTVTMGGDPPYLPAQPVESHDEASEPVPTPRTMGPMTPPMIAKPALLSAPPAPPAPMAADPPYLPAQPVPSHTPPLGAPPYPPAQPVPMGSALPFAPAQPAPMAAAPAYPPAQPGPMASALPFAPPQPEAAPALDPGARSAGPRQTLQMVAEVPAPQPSWFGPATSPQASSVSEPSRPVGRQMHPTQLSIQTDDARTTARPPAAIRERAFELVWFAPSLGARLRAAPALAPLLGAEPSPAAGAAAVLSHGAPSTSPLDQALFEAVSDGGTLSPALLLLSGELSLPFDEVDELRTLIAAARPAARGEAHLAGLLDFAEEMARTELQGSPEVADGLCSSVRDAWAQANHVLPAGHLGQQVERALLFRRAYQRRELLGKKWIRALFAHAAGGGDVRPVPAYLPLEAAARLPLFRHFPARLVAEVLPQQDQSEASPVALRVTALAREIARRG